MGRKLFVFGMHRKNLKYKGDKWVSGGWNWYFVNRRGHAYTIRVSLDEEQEAGVMMFSYLRPEHCYLLVCKYNTSILYWKDIIDWQYLGVKDDNNNKKS